MSVASSRADENSPEFDPLNHAYAVYMGSGYYVSGGQSVFVLRINPKWRVVPEDDRKFGVRLRFNATFGFYNLKPVDLLEFEFPDRIGSFAFVPGVEFPIRMYSNWTLGPFLDFGAAIDSEFEEITLVSAIGLRSRAIFARERLTHLLWNELILARNSDTTFRREDDYRVFRIDYEMKGIVNYRIGKRGYDLGLLLGADYFLDPIVIDPPASDRIELQQRYEIGFTTGATERWRQLKLFTVPRIGISYRFGDNVSGVRFVLRTRY